jgi:hypothetical protein
LEELERRLRKDDVHVIHFMGHGDLDASSGEGRLFLQASDGTSRPVTGRELSWALQGCRSLRLLFLNACRTAEIAVEAPFAGVATAAIENAGLAAVVAMQLPVRDSAAVRFAAEVYGCLAELDDLDRAVAFGRRQLRLSAPGIAVSSWMIPVLFSRLDTGRLFRGDAGRGWSPAPEPVGEAVAEPRSGSGSSARRRGAVAWAASMVAAVILVGGGLRLGGWWPQDDAPPTHLASSQEPGTVRDAGAETGADELEGALDDATAENPPRLDEASGEASETAAGRPAADDDEAEKPLPAADSQPSGPRSTPSGSTSRHPDGDSGTDGLGADDKVAQAPSPAVETSRPQVQVVREGSPVYFEDFDALLSAVYQTDLGVWTLNLDIPGETIPPTAVLGPGRVDFDTARGRLELPVMAVDEDRQLQVRGLRAASP